MSSTPSDDSTCACTGSCPMQKRGGCAFSPPLTDAQIAKEIAAGRMEPLE